MNVRPAATTREGLPAPPFTDDVPTANPSIESISQAFIRPCCRVKAVAGLAFFLLFFQSHPSYKPCLPLEEVINNQRCCSTSKETITALHPINQTGQCRVVAAMLGDDQTPVYSKTSKQCRFGFETLFPRRITPLAVARLGVFKEPFLVL